MCSCICHIPVSAMHVFFGGFGRTTHSRSSAQTKAEEEQQNPATFPESKKGHCTVLWTPAQHPLAPVFCIVNMRAGRRTPSPHHPAAAVLTPPALSPFAACVPFLCRLFAACSCSTLSSAASQCGCPIKEGSLYFSTVAYLRPLESLTCLRQPGDSNHRPYWAQGAYLQGRIRSYATHEGGRSVEWKECSGSVEYSPLIPVGVDSPQEAFEGEYDEDDFWLRSGQMVVRLAVEEY